MRRLETRLDPLQREQLASREQSLRLVATSAHTFGRAKLQHNRHTRALDSNTYMSMASAPLINEPRFRETIASRVQVPERQAPTLVEIASLALHATFPNRELPPLDHLT